MKLAANSPLRDFERYTSRTTRLTGSRATHNHTHYPPTRTRDSSKMIRLTLFRGFAK